MHTPVEATRTRSKTKQKDSINSAATNVSTESDDTFDEGRRLSTPRITPLVRQKSQAASTSARSVSSFLVSVSKGANGNNFALLGMTLYIVLLYAFYIFCAHVVFNILAVILSNKRLVLLTTFTSWYGYLVVVKGEPVTLTPATRQHLRLLLDRLCLFVLLQARAGVEFVLHLRDRAAKGEQDKRKGGGGAAAPRRAGSKKTRSEGGAAEERKESAKAPGKEEGAKAGVKEEGGRAGVKEAAARATRAAPPAPAPGGGGAAGRGKDSKGKEEVKARPRRRAGGYAAVWGGGGGSDED